MEPLRGPSVSEICLKDFGVCEHYGFVLPEPKTELPDYYKPWMEIATNLTELIESHQLRVQVNKMPLLSTQYLQGHRAMRLAHLSLGFITMGYVWQEGERQPAKTLPSNLAVPYYKISVQLGLPPILVYADSVLANWRKKDPNGSMEIENLETIFTFPGGQSTSGFLLVSLMVEKAAAIGIKGVANAINAMLTNDTDTLQAALQDITSSLNDMVEAFKQMHDNVHNRTFYGVVRLYFSGWKDNPLMPDGLIYEGVSKEPIYLSGGSAAQSSTVQCFDQLLGIRPTCENAASFLQRMRDYMLPKHRNLLQAIASYPSIRHYVASSGSEELCQSYNTCVTALVELRNYHLNTVAKYITIPANDQPLARGCIFQRGTGGTPLMSFLKNVRDSTRKAIIGRSVDETRSFAWYSTL
ncbi:indoleamine 2,3-dioxygenase 2-like [Erpetoichthys calabaricus]|uniref:Indoleamine 2,3-dioxygenase 2-like n=1 Tax=Erpetoichthys calabaricus TaxID=27687 RepID=A0A8C4RNZ9_ERPCA|nr:indoleamine 2,3-dioxygenase 2-like [Erpetoichthys calabaricus]